MSEVWSAHKDKDGYQYRYADLGGLAFCVEERRLRGGHPVFRLWVELPGGTSMRTVKMLPEPTLWQRRAEEIAQQYASAVLFDFTAQPEAWKVDPKVKGHG